MSRAFASGRAFPVAFFFWFKIVPLQLVLRQVQHVLQEDEGCFIGRASEHACEHVNGVLGTEQAVQATFAEIHAVMQAVKAAVSVGLPDPES